MTAEEIRKRLLDAILVEKVYIESFRSIAKSETIQAAIDMELIGLECAVLAVKECEL